MGRLKKLARTHGTKHRHFLLYVLIGLSGVLLDYILFILQVELLGIGLVTANFIAISIAIVNNFWLNTKYNFKKTDHLLKRFALFYAVGALGIVMSEILIVGFHFGMGISEAWAKLLTLPFVLLFQFGLNKRFSFGDMQQTQAKLKKLFFHWPLFIVIGLYGFFSLVMIMSIPADFRINDVRGGPDEAVHYNFNVRFIMENHRLPISGQDDLEAYGACRENKVGLVPCVYSYTTYPGPNYIISAISGATLGRTATMGPETASRFTSLISGLAFVIFAYAAVYAIVRRRLFATILVASFAFIPQLIFTNSYTNMDAHSLAISAFLGFTLVKFWQQPRERKWQIMFAVALCGLVPISKFNYAPLALSAFIAAVYICRTNHFVRPEILRLIKYGALSFILLASFWYVKNLILYHDLIGQSFMLAEMAKHHALGTAHSFDLTGLNLMVQLDFFTILFRSFFVGFGLMNFFLPEFDYKIIMLLLCVIVSVFLYYLWQPVIPKKEQRKLVLATLLYVGTFAGVLGLILYNSLQYDFQPQGRYMYPVIIPTLLLLAYAIKRDKRFQLIPFLLLAGTIFVCVEGALLFIKVYFPV